MQQVSLSAPAPLIAHAYVPLFEVGPMVPELSLGRDLQSNQTKH